MHVFLDLPQGSGDVGCVHAGQDEAHDWAIHEPNHKEEAIGVLVIFYEGDRSCFIFADY